jgi:hypothetical protein
MVQISGHYRKFKFEATIETEEYHSEHFNQFNQYLWKVIASRNLLNM